MKTEPVVRVRGLSRGYREGGIFRPVLRELSLEVSPGESVGLLGRSGSGKSTLLNLLGGIDAPDAGSVEIRGTQLGRLAERERTLFRRRHIGFVYQFFNLLPTLNVEENVSLPLELNGMADSGRVKHLLSEVALGDRLGSFPDQLSGGEQQRVALVRALIHRPALILADEPTGNLDAQSGQAVASLLHRLVEAEGTTLILVTHSPEASAICDRLLHLEEGRLKEALPA
jgi:putative ABC transport system ATP-binding protein